MEPVTFKPIGTIRTPFKEAKGIPIQPSAGEGIKGSIEILDEFVPGLKGLEGFSHLVLLFHLHRYMDHSLEVVPFLDNRSTGVFSTRAPRRPNGIGLSIVRSISIEGNTINIQDLDIVDGTPLLDIKPFIPYQGETGDMRFGWMEGKMHGFRSHRSDERFDGGVKRAGTE